MNVGINKHESNNHAKLEEKRERTKVTKVFTRNKEVLFTVTLSKDL
jgi:hypothetical protein